MNINRFLEFIKKTLTKMGVFSFFGVGLLLTLSLLWPLIVAPYFSHHDDVQVIRLFEMNKCIRDFQIPCRWVPDLGGLYGYPLFNYYAPLSYYVGELFYLISGNLIFAAKAIFIIPFIGAYIFMYLLGKRVWGEAGGALSGIFYSFAPYHAVVFYVRGAMGELWALMLFPALLWSILRVRDSGKVFDSLLAGLFISLLILSHNLSTMIFLPILLLWTVILYLQKKEIRFVKLIILSFIIGLLLSAFYLIPMLVEKNLVHAETTTYGYFSYTEHFKGLRKLFLDTSWGWGASVREVPGGEKDGMSFQIGWVHVVAWLISLFMAKHLWHKARNISIIIIFSSLIAVAAIFMINPRSEFIWKMIPPLKYLQFPWRLLMIIIFFLSFLSGSIFLLVHENKKKIIWVLLVITVIAFNFSHFRPEKFLQVNEQSFLSGPGWDQQIKRSIFDFLPIYAEAPPAALAATPYEVLTGDTIVMNFSQGSNWIAFQTDTKSHSIIRISQYYFPEWKVRVDGREVPVDYKNNDLGLMTILLGEGVHTIDARLYDSPTRIVSNWITVSGIVLLIFLILTQISKTRKWIYYYLKGLNH